MNRIEQSPIHVYYNSACTVCRTGINTQMKKEAISEVEWKDIHSNNKLVGELNEELDTVRKYLYLMVDNKHYIGVDAFIKIWQNTPNELWKARIVSLPIIRQLTKCFYYVFANMLYLWNKGRKKW